MEIIINYEETRMVNDSEMDYKQELKRVRLNFLRSAKTYNLGQNKWNIWTTPPISMMPKLRVFAPSRLHNCFGGRGRGLTVPFYSVQDWSSFDTMIIANHRITLSAWDDGSPLKRYLRRLDNCYTYRCLVVVFIRLRDSTGNFNLSSSLQVYCFRRIKFLSREICPCKIYILNQGWGEVGGGGENGNLNRKRQHRLG